MPRAWARCAYSRYCRSYVWPIVLNFTLIVLKKLFSWRGGRGPYGRQVPGNRESRNRRHTLLGGGLAVKMRAMAEFRACGEGGGGVSRFLHHGCEPFFYRDGLSPTGVPTGGDGIFRNLRLAPPGNLFCCRTPRCWAPTVNRAKKQRNAGIRAPPHRRQDVGS